MVWCVQSIYRHLVLSPLQRGTHTHINLQLQLKFIGTTISSAYKFYFVVNFICSFLCVIFFSSAAACLAYFLVLHAFLFVIWFAFSLKRHNLFFSHLYFNGMRKSELHQMYVNRSTKREMSLFAAKMSTTLMMNKHWRCVFASICNFIFANKISSVCAQSFKLRATTYRVFLSKTQTMRIAFNFFSIQ